MLAGAQRGEHDARLLLMSATIDADAIAAHLDDAPVVSSAGRTYPIELVWRPKKRREPLHRLWCERFVRRFGTW